MRFYTLALTLLYGLAAVPVAAQAPTNDQASVAAVVNAFHAALGSGNESAAMQLIADDAVMLEAGGIETRSEYETNHLPADIEFEKAVPGKRKPIRVVVRGDVAWVITAADFMGTFQTRPVDFLGIELMVLSREPAGWRIRAIHWSSRNRRPPQ